MNSGDFDFERLDDLSDEAVSLEMKRLKGIGDWTADIYLSECLMRPDILPKGDIAMQEAFRVLIDCPKDLYTTILCRPPRTGGPGAVWARGCCGIFI